MDSWLSQPDLFHAQQVDITTVPPPLTAWVGLLDSMTEAVANAFGQQPSVSVHFSGQCTLQSWESAMLTSSESHTADGFARHISLRVNGTPKLFARSATISGNSIEPLLRDLQQTPLAQVLFQDDQWQRLGVPVTLRTEQALIGRVSVWRDVRTDEHLLVEEFFLF